jgi:dTDP-4-dehydrorhamnose 3,5-epimerase-like enzyme
VVSLAPGAIRGNHVHDRHREWLCAVAGRATLAWRDGGGNRREMELTLDRPRTVEVPPGIPHAVRGEGDRECILVIYGDLPFDPDDPDTRREVVIDQEAGDETGGGAGMGADPPAW